MGEPRSRFQRFAAFLDDDYIDIGLFFVPLILGASGFLITDEALGVIDHFRKLSEGTKERIREFCFFGIIIFTITHIIVFILHRRREKTLSQLEATIAELRAKNEVLEADNIRWAQEIKTLVSGHLFLLGRDHLGFGSQENKSERITFYVHDLAGYFIPVARYSSNTTYGKKGRSNYPDTEGCIGITWEHGEHFANDYPDPATNLEGYIARSNRDGMDREVVLNLQMKSRLLYGLRISDLKGEKQLAVIIVESTDENRYTKDYLHRKLSNREARYLSYHAERLAANLPGLSEAGKVGL